MLPVTQPDKQIRPNPKAEADPKSFRGDIPILIDLDVIHAAFCAGREYGLAEGQRLAAQHLAQEILSRQAAAMTGEAVDTARARHGGSWGELIRQQAVAS